MFLYINEKAGIEQSTLCFDNLAQCPMLICEGDRPDGSLLASIYIIF